IGSQSSLPVEIYHLKATGKHNWHKMPAAIARIQTARAAGIDVTADMYPYAASGTGLDSVLPPWVAEGGTYFETLADPAVQERIRREVLTPSGEWEAPAQGIGPEGVLPMGLEHPENVQHAAQGLDEFASMGGQQWCED